MVIDIFASNAEVNATPRRRSKHEASQIDHRVSYGRGLFGYQEGGFRTEVAFAALAEAGVVIALSAALAFNNATRSRES
jgi:hypothetical protein